MVVSWFVGPSHRGFKYSMDSKWSNDLDDLDYSPFEETSIWLLNHFELGRWVYFMGGCVAT